MFALFHSVGILLLVILLCGWSKTSWVNGEFVRASLFVSASPPLRTGRRFVVRTCPPIAPVLGQDCISSVPCCFSQPLIPCTERLAQPLCRLFCSMRLLSSVSPVCEPRTLGGSGTSGILRIEECPRFRDRGPAGGRCGGPKAHGRSAAVRFGEASGRREGSGLGTRFQLLGECRNGTLLSRLGTTAILGFRLYLLNAVVRCTFFYVWISHCESLEPRNRRKTDKLSCRLPVGIIVRQDVFFGAFSLKSHI